MKVGLNKTSLESQNNKIIQRAFTGYFNFFDVLVK